jgi:hypothetical protein
MVFAGVSGSATADASAIGSVVIPTMKGAGYKPGWSLTNLQLRSGRRDRRNSHGRHIVNISRELSR